MPTGVYYRDYNKIYTKERGEKISKSKKGKKQKPQCGFQKGHITFNQAGYKIKDTSNMGKSMLGTHHTEKEKKNLSEKLKGRSTWIKGKHHSPKTVEKIRFNSKNISDKTREKLSLAHKGEKHWNWQGGITPENTHIRRSFKNKLWIKFCLKRDNYTCQKTKEKGGKLVVHHINNFAQNPELRFDYNNGITLSKKSHIEFHSKYGIKNNTYEQLEEFLKQ